MKKTYHIVTRAARESAAVIEQFCQFTDWAGLTEATSNLNSSVVAVWEEAIATIISKPMQNLPA